MQGLEVVCVFFAVKKRRKNICEMDNRDQESITDILRTSGNL